MNEAEQELVAYLSGIKNQKIGFMELRTDAEVPRIEIFLDARYNTFTSECIFDDCNDVQARRFLQSFLTHELSVGWSVSEQLSKLLSIRGRLVSEEMDHLLDTLNWETIGTHQLFLSYLALRPDGASWASRLLDEVPQDGRDGLLLACYRLCSETLDRKLMAKFLEWDAGDWSPGSTGELYALEQFIARWLGVYPFRDLESCIRIYFKHTLET